MIQTQPYKLCIHFDFNSPFYLSATNKPSDLINNSRINIYEIITNTKGLNRSLGRLQQQSRILWHFSLSFTKNTIIFIFFRKENGRIVLKKQPRFSFFPSWNSKNHYINFAAFSKKIFSTSLTNKRKIVLT